MRNPLFYPGYAAMWLLGLLPVRVVMAVGHALGTLMPVLMPRRRRICERNLELCFPEMPEPERRRLARANFRLVGKFVIGHAMLLSASRNRLRRIVSVEGAEHLSAAAGSPTIVFCPHFVGGNILNVWLSLDHEVAMLHAPQHGAFSESLMRRARSRFGGRVFHRRADLLRACRWVRSGRMLSYSPDMDMNMEGGTVFVPFLKVERTATTIAMSRLARLTGAKVLPVKAVIEKGGVHRVTFYPVWEDYPSGDDERDAERMNLFLSQLVLEDPGQYYWLHRRFKTRPAGEPGLY